VPLSTVGYFVCDGGSNMLFALKSFSDDTAEYDDDEDDYDLDGKFEFEFAKFEFAPRFSQNTTAS